MAKSSFSGPVRSKAGYYMGAEAFVDITADTTLTEADHSGRTIFVNDADCAITLPTITSENVGMSFDLVIETTATGLTISTDGTDKYVGTLITHTNATSAGRIFPAAAGNDIITFNGTTQGGIAYSRLKIVASDTNEYLVSGDTIGSGTLATPFSGS